MKSLLVILLSFAATAVLADAAKMVPRSGYSFMEPATQQLQDDDFLNPAFFLVDEGKTLWSRDWPGATGGKRSCQACHGDPSSMRGVATRYPKYDAGRGGLINLELKINDEIAKHLGAAPLVYESEQMLSLSALIGYQSRGMPIAVTVDDRTRPWWERGRKIFETRRGQLNLACKSCHQDHWGDKLRGDTISQGQINAFPIFRLTWGEVGSRHRMFTWCMESIRSKPYAYGSDEFLALELYLAVRGNGLPIETPGVRR